MSITEAQQLIQSLVRSEALHAQHDNLERHPPLTITLSRNHACGGASIAHRLSQRLGTKVWDCEILRAVAKAAHVEPELMAELDEKVRHRHDSWVYNFLSGKDVTISSYRRHLVNVLLALSAHGGIILGRGAHLVLANRPVFRLRVVGSVEVCARRLARRSDLDEAQAQAEVERINRERAEFLKSDFGVKAEEFTHYDLVLNTDQYGERWDDLTDLVLSAMAARGLYTHSPATTP